MKNLIKILIYNLTFLVLPAVIWNACKDKEMEELALSRRFAPALVDITNGETSATIVWSPSLFAAPDDVEYLVEVSKDGTGFSTIEFTTTTTASSLTVHDTDIEIREDHFARVKAIGKDGTGDSHWQTSDPFRITGEIFILPMGESDVVVDAAVIRWQPKDVITRIEITPQGGTAIEMEVTNGEAEAGEMTVSGLFQNTDYTVEIFKGVVPKGSVTFKTKPSYEDFHIIDLTGITGKPSVLADTLPDIPSGSVVLLKRGQTYDIASFDFSGSVTLTSGADFISELATVKISSNFNLVAGSTIDSLVFKNLNLTGEDFNGDYVFNINREGSIGTVRFENVRSHRFRGFFRMQTGGAGTKVQDLILNNCVVDSIREYGIAWTNNSNAIAAIRITNSTIYNARRVISQSGLGVKSGANDIVVANCTFNDAPSGGVEGAESNYFIDLGSDGFANSIMISNTIIGRTWNEGAGAHVRGARATSTNINVSNSYNTSDFLSTNESFQISGLLSYPASSTSLFSNPSVGNFSIVDPGFPGTNSTGDPRWRP